MRLLTIAALFIGLNSNLVSHAAEVWLDKRDTYNQVVVLEGVIEKGDFQRLSAVLGEVGPFIGDIWLYSPGGDAYEAMRIGELVNALRLRTVSPYVTVDDRVLDDTILIEDCSPRSYIIVPRDKANCVCASACSLIWLGGVVRKNSLLRIHRPKLAEQEFAQLTTDEAQKRYALMSADIEKYLIKYSFPKEAIEMMRNTPSYELKTYYAIEIEGRVPFFDELVAARCGSVSNNEYGAHESYLVKQKQGLLSEADAEKLKQLSGRIADVNYCLAAQQVQSRIEAFSKFFKVDYLKRYREK